MGIVWKSMGDDPRKRKEGGRFEQRITLDAVLGVFDEVRGPVVTSSDVAAAIDCTPKTAKRKLETLSDEGRIEGRETAGRTVWWRIDASVSDLVLQSASEVEDATE